LKEQAALEKKMAVEKKYISDRSCDMLRDSIGISTSL
jgi:hypothetical protein